MLARTLMLCLVLFGAACRDDTLPDFALGDDGFSDLDAGRDAAALDAGLSMLDAGPLPDARASSPDASPDTTDAQSADPTRP